MRTDFDPYFDTYSKAEAEKKAVFNKTDSQIQQIIMAQQLDATRQAQVNSTVVYQQALAQRQLQDWLQMQQAQAANNAANQKSPDLGFLTSGDAGYFEQPKFNFFKPINSLEEKSVVEKPKPTKVDPKIHRRKFNLDD